MTSYAYRRYPYRRPAELDGAAAARRPVLIVGAGPVGLAAAIDLAQHGIPVVLVDDNDVVSVGSRAICWSKRSLEILDRLGLGARMIEKGVTWQVGRVYHGERELYRFDLQPEGGDKMPAFVNLQQYYVEEYLIDRAQSLGERIDLRFKQRLAAVELVADGVEATIETPDGTYRLAADWLIAADGARSAVRALLGLPFEGHTFEEKFLIVDVRIDADYPSDRRFWFEPTFDRGESVLIHRQPDNVFRIDFQLGWDADPEAERDPERAMARVRRVIGPDVRCEYEWSSVYTFRCARLARFVHGRVLFAGDSAHVVSPFGARGGNGGLQDSDNLCWKLAAIIRGEAPTALLESYERERGRGADENILNSSRTTTFMTPKSRAERLLRESVLALAPQFPFARALVNSGRLSRPCPLCGLPGFAADDGSVAGPMRPGMPCADGPLVDAAGRPGWLLETLGTDPVLLAFAGDDATAVRAVSAAGEAGIPRLRVVVVAERPLVVAGATVRVDRDGVVRARYGGAPGVSYLIRPDQHVLGRWPRPTAAALAAAWRACLRGEAA
ncbi:MAG: FAD-dependent oxidoreductase [Proteobacteria bacterium]|nr:FAD-dependent oxidoreductase [Pseudomonadota bacterium]